MNDLETMLAEEFARVADRASRWSDPVTRIRTAARRQQQRQFAVVAAAGVMTGAAGLVALPRIGVGYTPTPDGAGGDVITTSSPSPSAEPPTEPGAPSEPGASPSATAVASRMPEPSPEGSTEPEPSPSATSVASPSPQPSPKPSSPASYPPAPYGPGMEIGREYAYGLYTHCGIEFAHFDGRTWRTEPLNDGSGNPPPGWDNPSQSGTVILLELTVAEFRGDNGQTLRFEPTVEQPGMCE